MSTALRSMVTGVSEDSCGIIGPFLLAHGGERSLVEEARSAITANKGLCIVDFERRTKKMTSTKEEDGDEPKKKTIEDIQFDAVVQMPADLTLAGLQSVRERMQEIKRRPATCVSITEDKCTVEEIKRLQDASTRQAQGSLTSTEVKSATWIPGRTVEEIEQALPAVRETDKRGFTMFMCANKAMGIDENSNCFDSSAPLFSSSSSISSSSASSKREEGESGALLQRMRVAQSLATVASSALAAAQELVQPAGGCAVAFPMMKEMASKRSDLLESYFGAK